MAEILDRACVGVGPAAQSGAALCEISCASRAPDCDVDTEVCFLESERNRASFIIIVPVNCEPESEPRTLRLPARSKFRATLRVEPVGILRLLSLYMKNCTKAVFF